MSDENTPKLRLRPKLAGAPPAPPPPAQVPPPAPIDEKDSENSTAEVPLAMWPITEPKSPPLRAKLSLKPEVAVPAEAPTATPPTELRQEPVVAVPEVPTPDPAPAKPVLVPRLKPTLSAKPAEEKAAPNSGATPPFGATQSNETKLPAVLNAPPPPKIKVNIPTTETWPAVLDAPPPSGMSPVLTPSKGDFAAAEPAEITAIRKASTFPFPQPTAKFPPLPGLGGTGGTEPAETENPEGFLRKILLIGGAVLILLIAGAVFAYFKYFAKPAAPSVTPPAPIATKAQPEPKVKQLIEKVKQEQAAPLNEVVAAEPAPVAVKPAVPGPHPEAVPAATTVATPVATTAPAEAVLPPVPPPAPVKPLPPPPSLAFKAWVINLKIRGVRGGDAQRVFIDKISYVPGDIVNQQLGIMFAGYDEETRMLTFKDKTGATFERRH